MPEVLGNPPSPRAALFWNGTAWQWARVDAQGHLQIDALSTVMDPLAATAAAQALALAQLQTIAEMRDALQSVATDRLIVRGEDQLISHRANLASSRTAVISGAGGYVASHFVPAGEIWKVTNIAAVNVTTATTAHNLRVRTGAASYIIKNDVAAYGAGAVSDLQGEWWLDPTDEIWVYFIGGLVGDTCEVHLIGLVMTLEV